VRVTIREYKGPLTVLAAGTLGFSLFCIVSAAALADQRAPNVSSIKPQNIVDSAFSNISTIAALTVEVVSQYIYTPTPTPTSSLIPTSTVSNTPTLFIVHTRTPIPPTRTRGPGFPPTATHIPSFTPNPTNTHLPPTDTFTPIPPDTDTPVPTDTLEPTNTPIPPDTNTPEPQPTDTPAENTPTNLPVP
jgi:hypothetical protein